MHNRMFVTISTEDCATSDEARRSVTHTLLNDDLFCGQGGQFGGPVCDSFVIGGRWSGLLAETIIGPTHKAAVLARFPEMEQQWLTRDFVDRNREELDAIWQQHGGTGPSPYTRGGFHGYPDDAMVLTQLLYDALLAGYQGEVISDDYHFADLDEEELQPDFVGRKWLVIVDYHF